MSEAALWKHLDSRMGGSWVADRVECRLPVDGFPDVFWSAKQVHGALELKYLPKQLDFERDCGHVLRVSHYTVEQRNFAFRHGKAGGKIHLLLQVGPVYWVFGWHAARLIGHATVSELRDLALLEMRNKIDPEALLRVLTA